MSQADEIFDQLARRLRVISVHFAEAADEIVALRKALAEDARQSQPGQRASEPDPPRPQPGPVPPAPGQWPGPQQHSGYPAAAQQWTPPPQQQWPGPQQPQ